MSLDMIKNKPGTNLGHPMVGNLFQNMNTINAGATSGPHGITSPMQTNSIGMKKQSFIPSLQANVLNQQLGMHPQAQTTTNKGNNGKGRSFSRATEGPGGVTSPKNFRAIYNNQRKNNIGGSAGGNYKVNQSIISQNSNGGAGP